MTHPRVRIIPAVKATPRRSLEGLGGALMVLSALPVGLMVNVALYASRRLPQQDADVAGFATTAALAAAGAVFSWHARTRIHRNRARLRGLTTVTVALYGGLCILTGCAVVLVKRLTD